MRLTSTEYSRRRRAHLRARGKCRECPRTPAAGHTRCERHLAELRQYRERRKQRAAVAA